MSLAKILSLVALMITLVPCVLYFFGSIDQPTMNWIMLSGTIFWFVVTPLWMGRRLRIDADQVEI